MLKGCAAKDSGLTARQGCDERRLGWTASGARNLACAELVPELTREVPPKSCLAKLIFRTIVFDGTADAGPPRRMAGVNTLALITFIMVASNSGGGSRPISGRSLAYVYLRYHYRYGFFLSNIFCKHSH